MGFGHAQGQRLQVLFNLLDEVSAFERRFSLGNTFNIFGALKVIRQEIWHSNTPNRANLYIFNSSAGMQAGAMVRSASKGIDGKWLDVRRSTQNNWSADPPRENRSGEAV